MNMKIKRLLLRLAGISRRLKLFVALTQDAVTVVASLIMAMVLRLEVASCLWDARFWLVAVQMAVVTLAGLAALGVYRTMIRYVSFHLLPAVALAVTTAVACVQSEPASTAATAESCCRPAKGLGGC